MSICCTLLAEIGDLGRRKSHDSTNGNLSLTACLLAEVHVYQISSCQGNSLHLFIEYIRSERVECVRVCMCREREREREESRTNLLPPSAISNTGQLRVLTNGHERNTIVRNVGFSRAHLPKEARPCGRSHEPRLPHRVVEWLHRCTQRLWGRS